MLKLLLLLALVGGGLWWFARGGRLGPGRGGDGGADRAPHGQGPEDRRADEKRSYEKMVRCEYCNTHVPQSQAVFAGRHGFCCEEHRAASGY